MNADPTLHGRLSRAIDDLPIDLERRLDAAHTGQRRTSRLVVYTVAALFALLAVFAAWRLLPGLDRKVPADLGEPSGTIVYSVVDDLSFDEDFDVYTLNVADGTRTPLIVGSGSSFGASYAPDGSRVAFTYESSSGFDLMVMNADGSDLHVLTRGVSSTACAWSPDGTRIAYISGNNWSGNPPVLETISVDGGVKRWIASGSWESLTWSPDSTRIAATGVPRNTDGSGHPDLYAFDVGDGSASPTGTVTALTDDESYELFPSWSPDGASIAFMRSDHPEGDYHYDIYVVGAGGGAPTRLTEWSGIDAVPVWSPDGRWIAFASDRNATEAQQRNNTSEQNLEGVSLFVMASDGGDVREVLASDLLIVPGQWTGFAVPAIATPVPQVSVAPTAQATLGSTTPGSAGVGAA
jgi:Tol biopolymer transport system component